MTEDFPDYFADAESEYKNARYVIFGVPFGGTSSYRFGADKGPSSIRKASWNFETYDMFTGNDLVDSRVHDYGNIDVTGLSASQMVDKVFSFSKRLVEEGKIPICLGGEHCVSSGIVKAFPLDIAVVSLDAHMDFREEYTKDRHNHACVMKRIADHIPADRIHIIGVRSAEKEEYDEAKSQGVLVIDSFEINEKGIERAVDSLMEHLAGKKVYLTIDIDVIDPGFAPGTSTPEPFGLTPFQVLKMLRRLSSEIIGFDVVEVSPSYDDGQSSFLAAKLVRMLICMQQV